MAEKSKIKVLVAMSGGVDSAVVAMLLVKAGYDVTGAFMVNYDSPDEETGAKCWQGDYQDALRVAAKLGINLLRLNFVKDYKKYVLQYLFKEYKAGRTPNPDIMCNKFIKFGVWLKYAEKSGYDYLATGHYAQLKKVKTNNQSIIKLLMAKDEEKDQTYFLHQLNQKQLRKAMFPLGGLTKKEVRYLAKDGRLAVADKAESMGICLVGDVKMDKFLEKNIHLQPGEARFTSGEVCGTHQGLFHYTIGQRFGVAKQNKTGGKTEPIYVVKKIPAKNLLLVGNFNDPLLSKNTIEVKNIHWIGGESIKMPFSCLVRFRHRQALMACTISQSVKKGRVVVDFQKPVKAVAPGQFAVFYKNNICLGGGEIV